MTDSEVLNGLQAIDQLMCKSELAFLNRQYYLLYQSLIPNCKLTIKILRRHFTITDQAEQYILSGDSRRLCCQRVMNLLLVHLDIVKDHHQFCDWLDSVLAMDNGLIEKIKTEFSACGKYGQKLSTQSRPVTLHKESDKVYSQQQTVTIISGGAGQQDDSVMDNVITSCTVRDEVVLVDKASSCIGNRRRLVRHQGIVTTVLSKQTSGGVSDSIMERIEHVKSLLQLKCLLNSSEWSIVNTCLPVLCESLPDDYQSTIEKLKTLPQFLGSEQQQQLNSLIPATLTDVKMINKKIITFMIITLSFSSTSGGMTRLCEIMDELIGSTSCVQEVQFAATSNEISSPEGAVPTIIVSQQEVKQSPDQHTSTTTPASTTTCTSSVTDVVSSDDVDLGSSQVVEESNQADGTQPVTAVNNLAKGEEVLVPQIISLSEDFSQLKGHYHTILQLMPDEYEQSVGKLQSHFSDDQLCDILCSSNCKVANNKILNCLVEKMSCKEDLLDLCVQLEKISNSNNLMVIIQDLKTSVIKSLQLPSTPQIPDASSLLSHLSTSHQHFSPDPFGHLFQLAFSPLHNSKVIAVLKKNFLGLCRCLPQDHRVTIERLNRRGSLRHGLKHDLDLLPTTDERNGMILAIVMKSMQDDLHVLILCDILEDVVDNNTSKTFIQDLRSELIETLSMNGTPLKGNQSSRVSINDEVSAVDDEYTLFFDHSIAQEMMMISPNSKALAVIRKHFAKLCQCLPDDYKETISRVKRTSVVPNGLIYQLAMLPTSKLANCHILAAMITPLGEESHLVGFCQLMKNVVDGNQSMMFVEALKVETMKALNIDETSCTVLCLPSPNSEYSDELCTSFFDQAIARNMEALRTNTKVFSLLRRNFKRLCHCLPKDYKQTITRIKRKAGVRADLVPKLEALPTTELINCHILAGMIAPVKMEIELLEFCDWVKELVDGTESKTFVDNFKAEVIKALTTPNDQSMDRIVLCVPSSGKGTSGDVCTSFFDQAIVPKMDSMDPKCLAVLRKNFTKLCHCLPQDFKQTIRRIKRTAMVPDDTVYKLSKLPTFELANCHILAAMIRPFSQEVGLIRFCDSVEELVNDAESKIFIESLRNELTEAQSVPIAMTVATTPGATQPGAVVSGASSNVTITSPVEGLRVSDVTDVPVVAETMCTQPTAGDEELLEVACSTDPLVAITGNTATVNTPTSQSPTEDITDHPIEQTSDVNTQILTTDT